MNVDFMDFAVNYPFYVAKKVALKYKYHVHVTPILYKIMRVNSATSAGSHKNHTFAFSSG